MEQRDNLTLKWGTLKAWDLKSEAALAAMDKLLDSGARSMSAMAQSDSLTQKQLLCDLIDALDAETVYLDWDAWDVSKEEAKEYVMEYKTGC